MPGGDLVIQVAAVVATYVLMSALAFALFWMDKRRAARCQWRLPERTLHVVEILGGWPGAWATPRGDLPWIDNPGRHCRNTGLT